MNPSTSHPMRRSPIAAVLATSLMASACAALLAAAPAEARPVNTPMVCTSASTYYMDESVGIYEGSQPSNCAMAETQTSASTRGQNAWALASLSGGLMRISGNATSVTPEHPEEQFHRTSSSAQAVASMYDNLIIDTGDVIPVGGLGTFMPWSVTIDGSVSGFNGIYFGSWFGDEDWAWTKFTGGELTIEGEFALHAGQNIVPFAMSIQGGTGSNSALDYAQGGSFDLSHTVRVHFNAPTGMQVTSSSGLFPIGSTASTLPEPGTAWLAAPGLLGLLARRRRARPA